MYRNQLLHLPSIQFAWQYAKSQLRTKYRYTVLGFLWNFLEPALYLVILSLVFSVVNRMNINDYAVFLFSALVPWRYFEKVVNTIMESIVNGEWVIKKMYVSPFAFPLNRLIISSFEFLFSMISAFILFIFLKENWSIHLMVLPISIIPWALLATGIGLIAAVLYTFFRDVKPLVQLLLTLTFFTSPILFKPDIFETGTIQQQLMQLHPFTYLAALFQKPVYMAALPTANEWIISFGLGIVALLFGIYLVNKYKSKFYYYL
jgi:ABC-type polysaccharide/polyol phosphate export permease